MSKAWAWPYIVAGALVVAAALVFGVIKPFSSPPSGSFPRAELAPTHEPIIPPERPYLTAGIQDLLTYSTPTPVASSWSVPAGKVLLTVYTCTGPDGFCGPDGVGETAYGWGAACGYAFERWDRIRIVEDGTELVCTDRGAPSNPLWWVDRRFYSYEKAIAWRATLPRYVTIEVLQ